MSMFRFTLNEIGGQVTMAVLVVGGTALVLVGLSVTSVLDWVTTAAILTATVYFSGMLRGTRVEPDADTSGRFAEVFGLLRRNPWTGWATKGETLRLVMAAGFGALIATLEQGIAAVLFGNSGWPSWLTGTISLSIVLLPTYFLIGLARLRARYQSSEWLGSLRAAVERLLNVETVQMRPWLQVLVAAALKTFASVTLRAIAVVILPPIFGNWYFVGGFVAFTVALIAAWPRIGDWLRTRRLEREESHGTRPERDRNEGGTT
jgi:hypothetical protein